MGLFTSILQIWQISRAKKLDKSEKVYYNTGKNTANSLL